MFGPVVRGVHEDPQRDGSTGTPITIIVMSPNCPDKLTKFMGNMLAAFTLVLWVKMDQQIASENSRAPILDPNGNYSPSEALGERSGRFLSALSPPPRSKRRYRQRMRHSS